MRKRNLILTAGVFFALFGGVSAQVMPGSVGSHAAECRIPMKIVEAAIGESTLLPAEAPAGPVAAKQAADTLGGAVAGVRHFLAPNAPNPFRETTTISYSIARNERVTLKVYDAFYNQISVLVDEEQAAGLHSVVFNANGLSSGFFFYSLSTNSLAEPDWGRMVLMR